MIRTSKMEHGVGNVTFPEYPGEAEVWNLFIEPKTVSQLRREAKKTRMDTA